MIKDKTLQLTDTELDIMLELWEIGTPIRPSQLLPRFESREWSISTLKTLLDRLVAKEAADVQTDRRFFSYYPKLTKEEFLQANLTRLSQKIHCDTPATQLQVLLRSNKTTKADLDEMASLLAKARNEIIE